MNDSCIQLFDKACNLIPVFSIEGEGMETDRRRGSGIYQYLISKMDTLKKDHIPFGASITVTTSKMEDHAGGCVLFERKKSSRAAPE